MEAAMITEPDPHDETAPSVLEAAWRFRNVVYTCIGAFAVLGLLYGVFTGGDASATARLILRDPSGADLSFPGRPVTGDYERFVRAQARFASSDAVLAVAAESVGISLGQARDRVTARAGSDGDVLIISASGSSGTGASELATAATAAYREARAAVISGDADRFLDDLDEESLLATGDTASSLDTTAADRRLAVDAYGDGVAFVEHVEVDESNAAVGVGLPFVGGGILGAIIGLITAWVLADRNPRIEHAEDVAIRHGVTLVGRVPRLAPDVDRDKAYDVLSLALEHQLGLVDGIESSGRPERQITLVASVVAGGGTTTTLDRTSRAAAESGLRVCVIDATTHLQAEGRAPEVDDVADALVVQTILETSAGGEAVLVSPIEDGPSVLSLRRHRRFGEYLERLRSRFDMILVDCPSLDTSSTALKLVAESDGIVLVVPHGADRGLVDDTIRMLDNVAVPIVGYVLTFDHRLGETSPWRVGNVA
jgi:Mrp family chromosome partitioning ATPase